MIGARKFFYYVGTTTKRNKRKAMFDGELSLVTLRADSRAEADAMAMIWADVGPVSFGWVI